mgnify:CR=1 FL=1
MKPIVGSIVALVTPMREDGSVALLGIFSIKFLKAFGPQSALRYSTFISGAILIAFGVLGTLFTVPILTTLHTIQSWWGAFFLIMAALIIGECEVVEDQPAARAWMSRIEQVKPLYVSLHAYVRWKLRERHGDAVPAAGPLPASARARPPTCWAARPMPLAARKPRARWNGEVDSSAASCASVHLPNTTQGTKPVLL